MTQDFLLKPCPCCDGDAKFCRVEPPHPEAGAEYVECKVCGLSTGLLMPAAKDSRPFLAEMWNRRVGEVDEDFPDDLPVGRKPLAWRGLRAALAAWLVRGTGFVVREVSPDAA